MGAQLARLFTPASVLLLVIGLGLLYWIVVRHAFEEDNAVFADKLAAVRTDLVETGNPTALASELQNARSKQPLRYYVRVVRADGTLLAESRGMSETLPRNKFPPSDSAIRKPREIRAGTKLLALGATSAEVGGERYTIEMGQDRTADERFEREFGVLTLGIVAAGAIASAFIAKTVARHGLRPLHDMQRSIERINPAQFDERIATRGWPAELQPLASAFDAMIERLESSFNRLSQFSADLAHELRTPITNMLGEAQVALTRSRSADEYREVIESEIAECERLAAIVDNLLFLARAEGADRHVRRERYNARDAVEKIIGYYADRAEERQIALVCEGSAEVSAEPLLFNRALTNLIDNALRFTPDGGRITISIARSNGATEVTISDTGSGIVAEHLPRVFDRFYRADASRTAGGTGLGLAIVKSIAELHGGAARIESELGAGTTARLTFPDGEGNITNL